jgi:undecaprenyl-diphosphatase
LLAVGFITAFVVALFSIKFLLHFIQRHNFVAFGVYRIAIVIIFILLMRPH